MPYANPQPIAQHRGGGGIDTLLQLPQGAQYHPGRVARAGCSAPQSPSAALLRHQASSWPFLAGNRRVPARQAPDGRVRFSSTFRSVLNPEPPLMDTTLPASAAASPAQTSQTRFRVLGAISFSHFLNDMIQSLILAIYPLLKGEFSLSFAQIGLITLTYQLTASVLQPFIGMYTDRRPQPRALSIGMGFTLIGLLLLSVAPNFLTVIAAAALVGSGSSVFHPESSRVARLASGGQHGLAQSIFQVGGNVGTAVGPLLAAWVIIPYGRTSVAWFSVAALVAMFVLWRIGDWY